MFAQQKLLHFYQETRKAYHGRKEFLVSTTVKYSIFLKFCLRGVTEHRNLKYLGLLEKLLQYKWHLYTEHGSRNNQGGLSSLNQRNKTVKQYETDSEQCHVKILDKNL